eukprot:jgi/Tetstr1/443111/TSEL_031167.t1
MMRDFLRYHAVSDKDVAKLFVIGALDLKSWQTVRAAAGQLVGTVVNIDSASATARLVEEGVLVAAVTEALYERCNSQHTQGGRKFATASFKNIPADLLVAFCQSRPELWHLVKDTTDRKGKRVVRYITYTSEGVASVLFLHEKHGDPLKPRQHRSAMQAARHKARREQHARRGAHGGVRMTDRGDMVSVLYPLALEVTETPYPYSGSTLLERAGTVLFHTGVVAAKKGADLQLPTGYPTSTRNPKAWPHLPPYADPEAYAMRELQVIVRSHFMHLVGATDDSDALQTILDWDCSAPIPPPPPRQIGGSVFRWEGPPGESEADRLERRALWAVRPQEQRELRARAARLRAEQRQQRMELESARSDSDTEERDMPSPCSAESFTSIDSWDAAHFPAVRQHYRQKMARRAAEAARLVEQEAAEPEAAAGTAGPSTRPRRYNVVYGRSQKGKAAH